MENDGLSISIKCGSGPIKFLSIFSIYMESILFIFQEPTYTLVIDINDVFISSEPCNSYWPDIHFVQK